MTLSCIFALSENYAIGRSGDLPWHLPGDLKRFKKTTMGHPIVMGRKTYESIGRPLPGRTNVVVTRNPNYSVPGTVIVHSLDEALEKLAGEKEVFVTGGVAIYRLALPKANRLYVTQVHAVVEGDVFIPADVFDGWKIVSDEPHPADEKHSYPFSFRVYERV